MCARYTDVVVIDPSTRPHKELSWKFPELTRSMHTVNVIYGKFVVCGGYDLQHRESCIFFSPILQSWENFSNLTQGRIGHSSFVGQDENREDAIVILGNKNYFEAEYLNTIEVVQKDSSTLLPTRLPDELNGFRGDGCTIQDGKTGILTGGHNAHKNKATRLGLKGKIPDTVDIYIENLPSFNIARTYHACGKYINGLGQTVLLVAGGQTDRTSSGVQLYSTETLIYGEETQWTVHENTISEKMFRHYHNLPLVNNKLYDILEQKMFVWIEETKRWNNTGIVLRKRYNSMPNCAVIPLNIVAT